MKHSLMVMGLAACLALSGCQNMDTKKVLIGAAALGAIGAAGYYAGKKHSDNKHEHDGQHDDSDDQHMATSKMPRYCSGEAASKFHVSPRDITTESAERVATDTRSMASTRPTMMRSTLPAPSITTVASSRSFAAD